MIEAKIDMKEPLLEPPNAVGGFVTTPEQGTKYSIVGMFSYQAYRCLM